MASFISGPAVNPFARASQEPVKLLEDVTAAELASAVPVIRITKLDSSGHPDMSTRPMMFDLIQGPQFGSTTFGEDVSNFAERSLVSLVSAKIVSNLAYGFMNFREITLDFIVHQPHLVFDRFAQIPWRMILEEGASLSMEYGWQADPSACPNPLFNGHGFYDEKSSLVVNSTQTVLLIVYNYSIRLQANGEVAVTVNAKENGDIAFREARFTDVFDRTIFPTIGFIQAIDWGRNDDATIAHRLTSLLDGLPTMKVPKRGNFYQLSDVLDRIAAPMIETACKQFGYAGGVDMFLGNFNDRAGPQSQICGGKTMAGESIGKFMVNVDVLKDRLSKHVVNGKSLKFKPFLEMLISLIHDSKSWEPDPVPNFDSNGDTAVEKPNVALQTKTLNDPISGTCKLIVQLFDRHQNIDTLKGAEKLSTRHQTHAEVFKRLSDANVPIIEFGRAGSLILDASFDIQTDGLLQGIQIGRSQKDRVDRVERSSMPDTSSRAGEATPGELIPASTLQGSTTHHGNFVFETFGQVWIEFYGASAISGLYHAYAKTDTLEPGKFTTNVSWISDGIDPLNTRQQLTDKELDAVKADKAFRSSSAEFSKQPPNISKKR